jgi:hypothetical protein
LAKCRKGFNKVQRSEIVDVLDGIVEDREFPGSVRDAK